MMKPAEIHPDDVRSALRQLARDFSAGGTGLARLACVERAVADAGFSISEGACSYALGCLMQEIAADELVRLRRAAGLPVSAPESGQGRGPDSSPYAHAAVAPRSPREAILADFGCSAPLLESWSALHHLYLRPELGLDLAALERLLGDRHRRTLQRRVARGVLALTERLWQREQAARAAARLDALQGALPPERCSRRFGAEAVVEEAYAALFNERATSGLLLTGPGGSGKTTVARAVASRAIETGRIRSLRWHSAAEWGAYPPERLLTPGAEGRGPADGAPGCRPALLVVDGIAGAGQIASLSSSLGRLGAEHRCLLVARGAPLAAPGWSRASVEALPPRDSVALLRSEAEALGLRDLVAGEDAALRRLALACAGLPLALLSAARALRLDGLEAVTASMRAHASGSLGASLAAELWREAWGQSPAWMRRLLFVVVGLHRAQEPATLTRIARGSRRSRASVAEALAAALEEGFLQPAGARSERAFTPAPFLGRFVASSAVPARRPDISAGDDPGNALAAGCGDPAPVTEAVTEAVTKAVAKAALPGITALEVGPAAATPLPSPPNERAGGHADERRRSERHGVARGQVEAAGGELG